MNLRNVADDLRIRFSTIAMLVAVGAGASTAAGQAEASAAKYDAQSRTFRMDGSGVPYVFGVNEKEELQSLYWGNAVVKNDAFPMPHSAPGRASFDASVNATPREYVGWGDGLYVEPVLKITFPDGNRDLVLHYVSHSVDGSRLKLVMKDIEHGPDSSAICSIHLLQGNAEADTAQAASGAYGMNEGVQLVFRGDFQASAFVLEPTGGGN